MNNESIEKRLEKIKIEDIIWILYLIIIILSFIANSIERNYFIKNEIKDKKTYQNLMIFIFTILCIVYAYFTYDNYKDIKELKSYDSDTKIEFTYISFIATLLVLISGLLFLYIAINDENIETEIAFN
jgi:uncharacterized membrane protein